MAPLFSFLLHRNDLCSPVTLRTCSWYAASVEHTRSKLTMVRSVSYAPRPAALQRSDWLQKCDRRYVSIPDRTSIRWPAPIARQSLWSVGGGYPGQITGRGRIVGWSGAVPYDLKSEERWETMPGSDGPWSWPLRSPINDWKAAEKNAVEWLRWLGYRDARLTPPGPDGGIDVIARGALAQVKWQGTPVSLSTVQQLFGARGRRDGDLFFFTNAGYTQRALDYAEQNGIAAFMYDVGTGAISAVTSDAHRAWNNKQRLRRRAEQQARRAAEHAKRVASAGRDPEAARARTRLYKRFGVALLLATPVWWILATIVTDSPSLWRGTPGVLMLLVGLVTLGAASQWDKAINDAVGKGISRHVPAAASQDASTMSDKGEIANEPPADVD